MSGTFDSDEEWIELSEDPEYLVSTMGRLYDTRKKAFVKMRLLSRREDFVWIWYIRERRSNQPSRNRPVMAARAVLRAFEGPGYMPSYEDGDPNNIVLANLRWARARQAA